MFNGYENYDYQKPSVFFDFEEVSDLLIELLLIKKEKYYIIELIERANFISSPIYHNKPIIDDKKRYYEEYLPTIDENAVEIWIIEANLFMELSFSYEMMEERSHILKNAGWIFEADLDEEIKRRILIREKCKTPSDLILHQIYNLLCFMQDRILEIDAHSDHNIPLFSAGKIIQRHYEKYHNATRKVIK